LLHALASFLPDATPTGVAAGLHLYVRLPPDCPEADLVAAAHQQGVHIKGAARHWANPTQAPPALVIGYGTLPQTAIPHALATIGATYQALDNRA
jgi:GntR family transcriptional regulator / MocR family aminotransferase